ncbi:MAG: hypothetical protein II919_08345 [Lachnospiraceae bacterium]|nr:hypothetical protein [Lachnospiraceae bacterium]
MSQEYTLIRDIVSGHNERMHNIKKYYPFFKLSEVSFGQYKDGRYEMLDMGYILMAVLRFFIEENNFREKLVSYKEYADFMHEVLVRDFAVSLEKEEEKELVSYIFDKIKNDGKPFSYTYFDPEDKKKKTIRTKVIENKIKDDNVMYSISADAVAFYLDTKEMKEESNITVAQLLLSKMISTRNFKGGIEVIKRINNEVGKLIHQKNEILNVISYDVFTGIMMYEEFMDHTVKWFDEEQKLFKKNKELVNKALKSCESDMGYYAVMEEIYHLESELNKVIHKHSELLSACIALQEKTDEIIVRSKLGRIRSSLDFRKMLSELIKADDADKLQYYIQPLLKMAVKKTFSLTLLDNMLTYKPDDSEDAQKVQENEYDEDFRYPDEIEEERIFDNCSVLLELLFEMLMEQESFDLISYNAYLTEKLGSKCLLSADYYSFIVHLCQKNSYDIEETLKKPDTFLEDIICRNFENHQSRFEKYKGLKFEIQYMGNMTEQNHANDNIIRIGKYEISNLICRKIT